MGTTHAAWRWLKFALPTLLVAGGLLIAPVVLPVLPIERTDAYITAGTAGLLKNAYELTSSFHDMHGWENQARVVAEVFHRLSPEEQAECIIFAGNFGEAGAIAYYGPALGLPPVYSTHQNYYFWGPPARKRQSRHCGWGKAGDAAAVLSEISSRRLRSPARRLLITSRMCLSMFAANHSSLSRTPGRGSGRVRS